MSTYNVLNVNKKSLFGGVPFGNAWVGRYQLQLNSVGGEYSQNQASALQIGDIIQLGVLPEGVTLIDSMIRVSTAFAGSTTCSLGFQYVSGVDSASVPQDSAYFGTGIALSSGATIRNVTTAKPIVTLPGPVTLTHDGGDAYLILTLAGAAQSGVALADIVIWGIQTGAN